MWWTITSAVLAVFSLLAVGAVLRRLEWLTAEADKSLLALTVRVLVPCLILDLTTHSQALKQPANLIWPPLAGVSFMVLGILLARLVAGMLRSKVAGLESPAARRTLAFTTGVYNYYYLPLPLATLVFPAAQQANILGVLSVLMVGTELGMWTIGVTALTGGQGGIAWRRLVNPPAVAVVAGVLLNLSGAAPYIPGFIAKGLSMLGQCAIPLALLLIGATIADNFQSAQWHKSASVVIVSCVLRLGLLPIVALAGAYWLPVSHELKQVLVLEGAMPAAMFPIVITRYYQQDVPTALRAVIGTSIVSLVTIPLWVWLGLRFIG